MYYETKSHKEVEVANALEAAQRIKEGKYFGYEAFSWKGTTKGKEVKYYAVGDMHADCSAFFETAVILEYKGEKVQIESITAGWCKNAEELAQHFEKAMENPENMGAASLIIGEPKETDKASFECGCCGKSFEGFVKEQLAFDQDAGYGICPDCSKWYK